MTEISGITELQMLEAEVASLQKTLEKVQVGEKTSVACARVVQSITAAADRDGFLIREGGSAEQNQYHTAEAQGGDGGCCVVL